MIRGRGPDDESGGRKDQVETVIEESMDGNYEETCLTSEFNTSPTTIFVRQNLLPGQPASAGLPHLSGDVILSHHMAPLNDFFITEPNPQA